MKQALDTSQQRVARRITKRQPQRQGGGIWEYPPLAEAMGDAGLQEIIKSVTRRQNMVAQYIATQPIFDLCELANQQPGARVSQRWWEQAGINLEVAKKRASEAATVSESELESELKPKSESNTDRGR